MDVEVWYERECRLMWSDEEWVRAGSTTWDSEEAVKAYNKQHQHTLYEYRTVKVTVTREVDEEWVRAGSTTWDSEEAVKAYNKQHQHTLYEYRTVKVTVTREVLP